MGEANQGIGGGYFFREIKTGEAKKEKPLHVLHAKSGQLTVERDFLAEASGHTRYPHLLRGLSITKPNQVWCADITDIPMRKACLFLMAVMKCHSKKVLPWRLPTTMDADFCVEVLKKALAKHGKPEIFNADQGSQFTSFVFTTILRENDISFSMDVRGR